MLYSIYIFQNAKEKMAIWVEEREWKEWGSGQKKGHWKEMQSIYILQVYKMAQ